MIFLAPYSVGRHGASQAPHAILGFRNGETHHHRTMAELPVHHYDALVTAKNLATILRGREQYVVLGGDHSITLGILRSAPEPVQVVMFDAHSDDYDVPQIEDNSQPLHSGNWLKHAMQEELVEGVVWHNYRGHKLNTAKSSRRPGRVHVTVDIDVLIPSEYGFATAYPEPGGCTLERLLDDIRSIPDRYRDGTKFTADLVEYDPTRDATQAGAWACSQIVSALLDVIGA